MRCGDPGYVQSFLDGELSRDERKRFSRHLQECETCHALLLESRRLEHWCAGALQESISVKQAEQVEFDVEVAWRRFQQRIDQQGLQGERGKGLIHESEEEWKEERSSFRMTKVQKWVSAAAAVALLAGMLSVPQVRVWADSLLSIFRVDRVELVKMTQADLREIESWFSGNGEAGMMELKGIGKIWADDEIKGREYRHFETVDAAKAAGYTPHDTPKGFKAESFSVQPSWTLHATLDIEKANRLLKQFNVEAQFDEQLDGKEFALTLPEFTATSFHAMDPQPDEIKQFTFYEAEAPYIQVPEDVDLDAFRNTFLQLPFLPPHVKEQLAGIEDWKRTLPIPYLQEGETTIREVSVKGNRGLYIEDGQMGILLWNRDGKLYRIESDDDVRDKFGKLMQIAEEIG
ncbi:anti-sigma factor [Bacillaceae bacterium]